MEEEIIKHLLKKNKKMTRSEAEQKARKIWKSYREANRERDLKRQKEFEEEWSKSLQDENDAIAFDYLSKDELSDYFSQNDNND